jgi:hypothetical protein
METAYASVVHREARRRNQAGRDKSECDRDAARRIDGSVNDQFL